MAWASFANLIPNLPDFFGRGVDYAIGSLGGMPDSKARKNFIHDSRFLRRRAYQDMTHSMKEAGLNPVLAAGATPGPSGAQMLQQNLGSSAGSAGVGSALAANRQAGVAESKAGPEIALTNAKKGLTTEQAINTTLGRAGILQEYEKNQAWIENMSANTAESVARRALAEQDAINRGAQRDKIKADIDALKTFGPAGTTWSGMLRALLGQQGNSASGSAKVRDRFNEAGSQVDVDYGNGKKTNILGLPTSVRDY